MHDAERVRVGDSAAGLSDDAKRHIGREPTVRGEKRSDGMPFENLHRQIRGLGRGVHVEHAHDMVAAQLGDDSCLPKEAPSMHAPPIFRALQYLEGDGVSETQIACAEDDTHPAPAE